jgi:hypothetical protein
MITFPENPNYNGELIDFERRYLFDKIVLHRPNIVLEIGTGSCGSTFYIVEALSQLGNGILYTCDPFNDRGMVLSNEPKYKNFIRYYSAYSYQLISGLLSTFIIPDFLFFDGPEEPNVALRDFMALQNMVQPGCVFMSHDWEHSVKRLDGNISTKVAQLRPYIHKQNDWEIKEELSGMPGEYPNDTGYNSVGMIYAIKKDI